MAIALSKGETFILAKKNGTTYIKSSTDYVEQALVVRNNIYVTGSAAASTVIKRTGVIELTNTNASDDPYIVFKPSTVAIQNFVLGYDDSQNQFALGTGNTLSPGATVFHVPSGSRTLHVDEGLTVTGSAYISSNITASNITASNINSTESNVSDLLTIGSSSPAPPTSCSFFINNPKLTNASTNAGEQSGAIFRFNAAEITFGKHRSYPYRPYIQAREVDGGIEELLLQPVQHSKVTIGYHGSTVAAILNVNGGIQCIGAVVTSSDKRLKQDILPIENALNKILMLTGVTYNWNKEFDPDLHLDDNEHIGLLAQDVEKIIPQIVSTDTSKNQLKSVSYTELIPVLIEAIKEQQTQINELKNKLKDTPYG